MYTDFSFIPNPTSETNDDHTILSSQCVGRGHRRRDSKQNNINNRIIDNWILIQILPSMELVGKWVSALATHLYFKYSYHPGVGDALMLAFYCTICIYLHIYSVGMYPANI